MDNIKELIDSAQRAQRNYDLTKQIPEKDLETLIYAAKNSPSKQNETHYSLYVFTEKDKIEKLYRCTKYFTLSKEEALDPDKGEQWLYDNLSVTNSQTWSNVLFVYTLADTEPRGATHLSALNNINVESTLTTLMEHKLLSIGISIGEVLLTAASLGYKTGCCSAFKEEEIQDIIMSDHKPVVMLGIGFPNPDMERRFHPEVYNRDVPERRRGGPDDENWRYPTFEKDISIFVNDIKKV